MFQTPWHSRQLFSIEGCAISRKPGTTFPFSAALAADADTAMTLRHSSDEVRRTKRGDIF
jgi:hypothetical protein